MTIKRKAKKLVYVSKWDHRKPLSGEKLKKLRQMFYRGTAGFATLEELGVTKPLQA